jgi:hypothetical protein
MTVMLTCFIVVTGPTSTNGAVVFCPICILQTNDKRGERERERTERDRDLQICSALVLKITTNTIILY